MKLQGKIRTRWTVQEQLISYLPRHFLKVQMKMTLSFSINQGFWNSILNRIPIQMTNSRLQFQTRSSIIFLFTLKNFGDEYKMNCFLPDILLYSITSAYFNLHNFQNDLKYRILWFNFKLNLNRILKFNFKQDLSVIFLCTFKSFGGEYEMNRSLPVQRVPSFPWSCKSSFNALKLIKTE